MDKRFKIVMLAINKEEDIVMAYDVPEKLAKMTLDYFKNEDPLHYYEMEEI